MKNSIILSINVYDPESSLIDYGVEAAKSMNLPLELFDLKYRNQPVVYAPETGVMPGGVAAVYQSETLDSAKTKMKELCDAVKTRWPLTNYKLGKSSLYSGLADKPDHLLEEVEKKKAKLLIIGNSSEHNLLNELFGTDETKMAEEADCPVLVIPKEAHFRHFKNIYYLLDREEPLEEVVEELNYLCQLAKPVNGNILLVYHTDNDPEIAKKEMAIKKSTIMNQVNYDNIGAAYVTQFDTIETTDMLTTSEIVSLFAFPKRQSSFLERLMDHDNTKHIILKSEIPVLVF